MLTFLKFSKIYDIEFINVTERTVTYINNTVQKFYTIR